MEPNEFEQIVSEHYESLYRFALSLTRAEADAQDLTQETFYVWANKGHQLRDRSKAKSWLFTTLHREFLKRSRRQRRFPHYPIEDARPEELPTLDDDSADRSEHARVLNALAEVDEVYQPAVALFYLQDSSYLEIARILQVPLGTVKSRIARGLAQLRRRFFSDSLPSPAERNEIFA
jgi:RNA polymerase sigma-70 factor (ECF subfamily)